MTINAYKLADYNDSDHEVVASYSGLYKECDVEHNYINMLGLASIRTALL